MKLTWTITGYAAVGMWLYGEFDLGMEALRSLLSGGILGAAMLVPVMWGYSVMLDRIVCLCWDLGEGPGT